MKKTLFLLVSVLSLGAAAQVPTFEWVKTFGGPQDDVISLLKKDASGNTYNVGFFNGTVDFDPGTGVTNLVSAGAEDIFITKLDASGNFLWAKSMGGTSTENPYAMFLDSNGNIYITGYFNGTTDLDPGPGVQSFTSAGGTDIFMSKLDASGNFVWGKRIGGSGAENSADIETDYNGGFILSGYFSGIVDMDPGTGTQNLTSAGNLDVFISRFNLNGDLQWSRRIGGTESDYPNNIDCDATGNVYVTGTFDGTVDFNPGAPVENGTSLGGYDIFIEKLTLSGDFVWKKTVGGTDWDMPRSITLDPSGNIYYIANFNSTVDFDPGTGVQSYTSPGIYGDVIISKLDNSGNFVWAKQISGNGMEICYSVMLDSQNNIYCIGGMSETTTDYDPGPGSHTIVSTGSQREIFILKLNSSGDFNWVRTITGPNHHYAGAMALDGTHLYVAGGFFGPTDFDPGAGVYSLTPVGSEDAFLLILSLCSSSSSTLSASACNSYTWHGTTYTASGAYTWVGTNAAGCDSTVTLNLTIKQPTTSTVSASNCSSYTWHGTTYTTSGSYTWIGTNAAGCDSTVTLNLTIKQPTTSTVSASNCSSYTWHGTTYTTSGSYTWIGTNAAGCDSTVTLNLTITQPTTATISASSCSSYTWHGNTYTTSGAYTWVGTNAAGCDSTVTLNLTIKQPTTATVSASNCSSYTWHGTTYTTSGAYTWIGTNAAGCDSTVTLNLTITQPTASTVSASSCSSYTWHGTTYTTSGAYTWVGTNAAGCDSTVTLNLTITQPTASTVSASSCSSYTWHGTIYTASGAYTWIGTNAAGCDSTVTLNLTIKQPTTATISASNCSSYMWHGNTYTTSGAYTWVGTNAAGCDSTVTLNLTITQPSTSTISETECGSYTWHGTTYTTSGAYTWVGTNAAGCDSTVTLNLIITNVNTTTSVSGTTISSNANGAAYRWLNCNNGMSVIPNQTGQTFTPTANGNYAVEITQNGCTDTSACVSITTAGLEESSPGKIKLYPNPTTGMFTLELDAEESLISIFSLTGQLIASGKTAGEHAVTFELDQPNGVYFVEVWNQQEQKVILKVIKE